MVKLEVMYIVRPELDEETMEREVVHIVERNGGIVTKKELWGHRRIAYEIDGCNSGRYGLIRFVTVDAYATAKGVDKALAEKEEVLNHMIIRTEG